MANIAALLKDKIQRLARREVNQAIAPLRKSSAGLQKAAQSRKRNEPCLSVSIKPSAAIKGSAGAHRTARKKIMATGANSRFTAEGTGALCKMSQDKVASFETGIVCIFPLQLHLTDLPSLADMLYAVTGLEACRSVDCVPQAGELIQATQG